MNVKRNWTETRTACARTVPGKPPSGMVAVSASTRADIANQISLADLAEKELLHWAFRAGNGAAAARLKQALHQNPNHMKRTTHMNAKGGIFLNLKLLVALLSVTTFATPAIADNTLFMRTASHLYAFANKKWTLSSAG
jgi:hypothetical protein